MALLLAAALLAGAAQAQPIDPKVKARIDRILERTPLVDGHNDLAWELRLNHGSSVEGLEGGTDRRNPPLMTDMERLRAGRVGGQFWSVYVPAVLTGPAAIAMTIEQIDLVKRMISAYPRDLALARTARDIVRIHRSGRIASLIAVEGGHSIADNLAVLRAFYDLGARSMTITHSANLEWADASSDDPRHDGLTPFGEVVIGEMNRLGMLVDLSHVSPDTMRDAIAASRAPVVFTHSNARALNDHSRNVPDDVLNMLPANGGLVMIDFYAGHLSAESLNHYASRAGEEARLKSLFRGQPKRVQAGLAAWDAANPLPLPPLALVADHIEHVARVAGHDHVGIGGDLDGDPDIVPELKGADRYPLLFAELIRRGWSDRNLAKLAGGNILRVMRRAEAVAAAMKKVPPSLASQERP